jgi:23S rRNA pseudouridine2605 synthase
MRIRFGIINLPPRLKRGMTAELGEGEVRQVLEWVGIAPGSTELHQQKLPPLRQSDRSPAQKPVRNSARAAGNARRAGAVAANKSKSGIKH